MSIEIEKSQENGLKITFTGTRKRELKLHVDNYVKLEKRKQNFIRCE